MAPWSNATLSDLTKRTPAVPSSFGDTVSSLTEAISAYVGVYTQGLGLLKSGLELANTSLPSAEDAAKRIERDALNVVSGAINALHSTGYLHALPLPPASETNEGWANLIEDSLGDREDLHRPMYGPNSPVAGVIVMGNVVGAAGGTNIRDVLRAVGLYISSFDVTYSMFDGYSIPIPKNFKGFTILRPDDLSSFTYFLALAGANSSVELKKPSVLAVKLQWSPRNAVTTLSLGTVKIQRINVYRSESPFRGEGDIEDLKPLLISSHAHVITTNEISSFVDTTIEEGKVYYYAAGYEVTVDNKALPSILLTHRERVDTQRPPRVTNTSSFPRWLSTPELPYALTDMLILGENMVKKSTPKGGQESTLFDTQIGLLTEMIAANDLLLSRIDNVRATLQKLTDLSSFGGLSVYPFSTHEGTPGIVDEIRGAFTADDAPKFTTSTTGTGFVMLAGRDSAAGINAAIDILEFVFGVNGTSLKDRLTTQYNQTKDSFDAQIKDIHI